MLTITNIKLPQQTALLHRNNLHLTRHVRFVVVVKMSKKRGKGLLNKEESKKEFATSCPIKYTSCMDPLLEGDHLRPGELRELCCANEYAPITNFENMNEREKDSHIYELFGKISKHKSEEYMRKWLSFLQLCINRLCKPKQAGISISKSLNSKPGQML